MVCIKLKQLTQCLDRNGLRPSNSDLISIVCGACNQTEVCPSLPLGIDGITGNSELGKARLRVPPPLNGQAERVGPASL